MDWSNDTCPICRNAAKEALPRDADFAEIVCDNCERYRITGTALQMARHDDHSEHRKAALRKATSRAKMEGGMPMISSDDFNTA